MIVPFAGSDARAADLRGRLGQLELRAGDEVLVADNRPAVGRRAAPPMAVRIVAAAGVRAPGFARNRAAALADGEWLVFIDADTRPSGDLLERYFEPRAGRADRRTGRWHPRRPGVPLVGGAATPRSGTR